jgi:lysophospholipase L1-like esterase
VTRTRRALSYVVAGLLVAAAAITLALVVTPMQDTTIAGEEIAVGAAAPTLSLSGPGEVDLFGQRLPTTLEFAGPVRPRLALSHITLDRQLASMFNPGHGAVPAGVAIGQALADAWIHYFVWEACVTGAAALLLTGALCGWARFPLRKTLILLGAGLVLAEAANLGGIMVTAYTAPARLEQVGSLTGLVGQAQLPTVAKLTGPERATVQAVVLGDSTAAALGNPLVAHPSAQDHACRRSSEAYAEDLAAVNDWDVLNLACSGATIADGVLGPQQTGELTVPAQLAEARQATNARLVIVSIGANDVGWSGLVGLCAAAASCADSASTAYFQQHLNTFASQYYQLLQQLDTLPSRPRVLINLYYNPFDAGRNCLNSHGLNAAKEQTLTKLLDALNQVLSNGATAASATPVQPDFTGHALCDAEPYVQGVGDPAPFHPTAAGELAIALADERALQASSGPPSDSPSDSPSAVLPSGTPTGTPAATPTGHPSASSSG